MLDEHQIIKITEKQPDLKNIGRIVAGDTNSNIIGYFVTKYGDYTKEQIEQLIHTLNCILNKC